MMIPICSMAVGPAPDCCVAVTQLSQTEALEGLVAPASAYVLLGQAGPVLIIIICFMAVTSSGASEMVAISSLFTFDVYRRYINPKVPPAVPHLKFKGSDACTAWSCLEGITACTALPVAEAVPGDGLEAGIAAVSYLLIRNRLGLHCYAYDNVMDLGAQGIHFSLQVSSSSL